MDTIKYTNSKIIQLHSQQLNFIDFSAEKMISTKAIPDLSKEEIQNDKHYIYGMIKSYKYENCIETDNTMEDQTNGQTENAQP